MPWFESLKAWASELKRAAVTLWMASRHPGVPRLAKALAFFVVAYALSPIDLIPDFIPVLGYLDDLILLPGLIWLALRMIPPALRAECREQADHWLRTQGAKPRSSAGLLIVLAMWAGASVALWSWLGA